MVRGVGGGGIWEACGFDAGEERRGGEAGAVHVALEEARIAALPVARVGRLRCLLLRCDRDYGMVVCAGRVGRGV